MFLVEPSKTPFQFRISKGLPKGYSLGEQPQSSLPIAQGVDPAKRVLFLLGEGRLCLICVASAGSTWSFRYRELDAGYISRVAAWVAVQFSPQT